MTFIDIGKPETFRKKKETAVYYDGAELAVTASPRPEKDAGCLTSTIFMDQCFWGNGVVINANFNRCRIDTVILSGVTFKTALIKIYNDGLVSSKTVNIERRVLGGAVENEQNVFIYSVESLTANRVEITFYGVGALSKLWVGPKTVLRLPSTISAGLISGGGSVTSDKGVVFGEPRYSAREISAGWDLIDEEDRREFERYFNAVQNIKPHVVQLFNEETHLPPLWGTLMMDTLGLSKSRVRFNWGGLSLTWREAK